MAEIFEIYPLSPLQQGMLYHALRDPHAGVDIEQLVLALPETVELDLLRDAWVSTVVRHPILRTAFDWSGDEARQVVYGDLDMTFTEQDLSELEDEEKAARFENWLREDRRQGFAMDAPPLQRWHLVRWSATEIRLLWTFHHALLDGRSIRLVLEDVFGRYDTPEIPERPDPRPFRDFIDWHEARDLTISEGYWRERLAGFRAPTPLTVDTLPDAGAEHAQADARLALDAALTGELRAAAEHWGVTLNTLVQGAWAILLSRYSGEADVCFGATRAGRAGTIEGAEAMVGLFINTVPVRTEVRDDAPLGVWLAALRQQWVDVRPHEHTPLARVQAWSELPPGEPLFRSLVVFENYDLAAHFRARGEVWRGRSIRLFEQTNLPICLAAYAGEELRLVAEYDRACFSAATVERLLGHLATLLRGLAVRPATIGDLALLPHGESENLLAEVAVQPPPADAPPVEDIVEPREQETGDEATPVEDPMEGPLGSDQTGLAQDAAPVPAESTDSALSDITEITGGATPPASVAVEEALHQQFFAQAARTPDAVALVQGETRLTYAELRARVELVARHLRLAGAQAETVVGLCLERTPELVVALLGILAANAAYLPIDLAYPPERLAFMLADAQAPVLLTQRHLADRLPSGHGARVLCIEDLQPLDDDPEPLLAGTPEQLCYVLYTSGSTGEPKGCCITHHNVARLFTATAPWFGFGAQDVWTLFHSTAFDFSVWELWGALLYGGRLVVVPFETSRSPEQFLALLAREKVTVLNQTPSAFRQLMAAEAAATPPPELALRTIIFGGEALEMAGLKPWFERRGDERPQLINMYGITETTVHVTYRPLRSDDTQRGSVIGQPIPDLQLYLLDSRLEPVPVGIPGELFVGGEGLARGYLRRPELTAERFIENPFTPGRRLYRTGDLVRRLPDGELEYLGRIDQQVKIRGFRIELGEIESVLLRHPNVREAVVLARDAQDATLAEDGGSPAKRLIAWLVADGEAPSTAELRAHLKASLPEYMVPAAFVAVDKMPLTPNGKLDTRALPEPGEAAPEIAVGYVAPRNAQESTLTGIWQRVLKIERVGIHDHFFELGGDSILSIFVVSQARQAGLPLTPKQIFDHPTIAELAAAAMPAPVSALPELPRAGDVPLTPIQRWFFAHAFADAHHWNQSLTLELTQAVTEEQLAAALDRVLAAHPVFSLRYDRAEDGRWRQNFTESTMGADCLCLPGANPQAALSLAAPLIACALNGSRLTIAIHHLIVDGVSWRILLEDLDAALRGVPLAAPTTGFHTWATALAVVENSPKLQGEKSYWEQVQAQTSADATTGEYGLESSSETHVLSFPADETARLLRKSPQSHIPMQDALLAALAEALPPWTGGATTLVELEGHGREEALVQDLAGLAVAPDLSRSVGWFTTVFPFLLRASRQPDRTFAQVSADLARVPGKGLGYSLLRARAELRAGRAGILFNYLGQFDSVAEGLGSFRLAGFSTEGWHAPAARRTHRLEINCLVLGGSLQVRWTFSRELDESVAITSLADRFAAVLRGLFETKARRFPLARIDPAPVLERFPTLEDLYPVSPMQQLFLSLESGRPGSGSDQWHCRLLGPLDANRFRAAWTEVLRRHPALRSAYLTEGEPHAAVLAEIAPAWHEEDWRGVPIREQDQRFAAYLAADATLPFDLAHAPLTRLALFRVSESEHRFVWTHHHLEIDGWSWPLVFRELAALYAGESLPEIRPYRDYIAWLRARPFSEEFWRAALRGCTAPTPLPCLPVAAHGEVEASTDLPRDLAETARRLQVTPSALVQAAWAILLAHHARSEDVVFGAALAGRPAELEGSEDIVGHFVNNVPIRARIDPQLAFREFAQRLHRQLAEISEHQYSPLPDILAWSELPWNARLFSTLLVFQNYQVTAAARQFDDVGVAELHAPVRTNYPLTLVINPGEPGTATLVAQPGICSREAAQGILEQLARLLAQAGAAPDAPLADFVGQMPAPADATSATAVSLPQASRSVANAATFESQIAEIWHEAFGRPVGVTENFFDLGGHSLLILQVHRRLAARLGRDLPIVKLFQHPTIRALARFLGDPAPPELPPALAAAPGDLRPRAPLTPAQQRGARARAALGLRSTTYRTQ